ncbi:MAG: alpha/beta hydrolase [Cyclobacteriaceae bacterium]
MSFFASPFLRKIRMIVITIITLYLVAGIALYLIQDKIIFLGEPLPENYNYEFNIPVEELNIEMSDGALINTLRFRVDSSKGLIVYYHGNAGNLARWGFVAEDFVKLGYDVAIIDYRQYGKSTGLRTASNVLADAEEVYQYFADKVSEDSIIVYGRSIGTGMASHVAARNKPRMLILETPYYSLNSLAQSLMPFFPVKLALKYKLDNGKNLTKVQCPVYIFHGTDDEVVSFEQGRKLFENADKSKTTFFSIEGGQHNNLSDFEMYHKYLESVLE